MSLGPWHVAAEEGFHGALGLARVSRCHHALCATALGLRARGGWPIGAPAPRTRGLHIAAPNCHETLFTFR